MRSFGAELFPLRKRAATWILLAVAILLSLFFTYVLPYTAYLSGPAAAPPAAPPPGAPPPGAALKPMLPESLVSSVLGGFPFYFGMLALILGVLAFGSEYGWSTLKTTLTQRPGRLRLGLSKLAALAPVTALFTAAVFAVAAIASSFVAVREGAAVTWPPVADVLRGLGAGWLLLSL
jgi:hypothetical protein